MLILKIDRLHNLIIQKHKSNFAFRFSPHLSSVGVIGFKYSGRKLDLSAHSQSKKGNAQQRKQKEKNTHGQFKRVPPKHTLTNHHNSSRNKEPAYPGSNTSQYHVKDETAVFYCLSEGKENQFAHIAEPTTTESHHAQQKRNFAEYASKFEPQI